LALKAEVASQTAMLLWTKRAAVQKRVSIKLHFAC
jgi:hypothetical protein